MKFEDIIVVATFILYISALINGMSGLLTLIERNQLRAVLNQSAREVALEVAKHIVMNDFNVTFTNKAYVKVLKYTWSERGLAYSDLLERGRPSNKEVKGEYTLFLVLKDELIKIHAEVYEGM